MKKKISVLLIGITFLAVLFLNVKIGLTAKSGNNINIKNLEALACYSVEINGYYMNECCAPWDNQCWITLGLPGVFTVR